MGLFASFFKSAKKSKELQKISKALAMEGMPTSIDEMMVVASRQEKAQEQLFDLIENDEDLSKILHSFGANRKTLTKCYRALVSRGAGQWSKGHWIAASALAFGTTLPFVLENSQNGQINDAEVWTEITWKVLDYFESGKLGALR